MTVFITCKFDEDPIKNYHFSEQHFPHYKSMGATGCRGNSEFWSNLRKNLVFRHSVASNSKVNDPIWPNSNSSEILCLSWLHVPASLKMIWLKVKVLCPTLGRGKQGSKMDTMMMMTILQTTFSPSYVYGKKKIHRSSASNSEANGPNWPKIKFIRDFMTVFVISKFDEDLIKNEVAILGTTFSIL